MRSVPAALAALLLVLSLVGPVAATHQQARPVAAIEPVADTTNQLAIPGDEIRRTEYGETEIDVGAAVEAGSRDLHHQHDVRSFQRRYETLDSAAAKQAAVSEVIQRVLDRERELSNQQATALRRYANGEISADTLLRTRALVDTEARRLVRTLDQIKQLVSFDSAYDLQRQAEVDLEDAKGRLVVLQGPVGQRSYEAVISGSAQRAPVYIESSRTGYVLATVADDRYVREAHLANERRPNATDQFVTSEQNVVIAANERAAELYPWLYEQQQGPSLTGYGTSGIYKLTADHANGRLVTYIDGGTTNVFHELQYRPLSTVEDGDTAGNVSAGVRLTLTRSVPTGPMLVAVTDNTTSEPLRGTVRVDGRVVGTTGEDGRLWTVEPRGRYTVTLTTAGGTNVTVAGSA